MSNYEKVLDFNKCFNHFVSENEFRDIFTKEPALVKLKFNLIKEESDELLEAFNNNDIVEIIDALCDILYVVYGLCVSFGINIDQSFKNYMNIPKIIENENENYKKKNSIIVREYIENDINTKNYKDYTSLVNSEIYEYLKKNINNLRKYVNCLNDSCNNHNFENVINNIHNILYYTYYISIIIDLDIDKAFDIVHNSNMSKICKTEAEAQLSVEHYKNNETRYEYPSYLKNEYGYIIFNKTSTNIKNCKTLKNKNYIKTDFSSLFI